VLRTLSFVGVGAGAALVGAGLLHYRWHRGNDSAAVAVGATGHAGGRDLFVTVSGWF
jgi:hypothetical protein